MKKLSDLVSSHPMFLLTMWNNIDGQSYIEHEKKVNTDRSLCVLITAVIIDM